METRYIRPPKKPEREAKTGERSGDCISRQAVLDALVAHHTHTGDGPEAVIDLDDAMDAIRALPCVDRRQHEQQ